MKKLILGLLCLLMVGLIYLNLKQFFPQTNSSLVDRLPASLQTTETSQESTTTLAPTNQVTQTSQVSPAASNQDTAPNALFHEQVIDSNYPPASLPEGIGDLDLFAAMETYYQEAFSEDEKAASQAAFDDTAISQLETALAEDPDLSRLPLAIDKVQLTLAGQVVNVPRIIVLVSYEQAEDQVADNDVALLNQAMTYLGNRLVMIGYMDADSDKLTVFHFTNWTNPLFSLPTE